MGSAGKRNYSVVHLNYMIKLSATVFPFIQISCNKEAVRILNSGFLSRTQPLETHRPGAIPTFPYFHVRELLTYDKILTDSKLQKIHK